MLKKDVVFERFLVSKVQLYCAEAQSKQNGEGKKFSVPMGKKTKQNGERKKFSVPMGEKVTLVI